MKQLVTQAIILARTDYGEADRILTVLTPQFGKLRLLAKGVRRVKSKLAGGIELFSVSEITLIKGRGDIDTLVSARLMRHYGRIVEDLDRTMAGYELIKLLNKTTEDATEAAYFTLMQQTFAALDDAAIPLPLVRFWFDTQLLRLGGHTPNLQTDTAGAPLVLGRAYEFRYETMSFMPVPKRFGTGLFLPQHIKFLRLAFAGHEPRTLAAIEGSGELLPPIAALVNQLVHRQIIK